jgi:hypothetical protein
VSAHGGVQTRSIAIRNSSGGGGTLRCVIRKLIMLIWNKEELPHQWKETIVVPIHKKGDKTDCSNYRGISLLSTSYKILSNILLSRPVVLTDIFPVAALAATVGFRWPLCINHTKKAVKFKYNFKLYQYFLI